MWAAVFPGQGSQHIGMGRFLFDNFKSTQLLFEEAGDSVKVDFKKLCFNGDEKELALTENTQPALLLTSVAYYKALQESAGIPISYCAGHSVGEYAAVVSSEALAFSDGIMAVRERGKAMQEAVPVGEGAMLAVLGLEDDQVRQLCQWAEEKTGLTPLQPANFNCPGQVVISGKKKITQWLRDNLSPEIFNPPIKRIKLIELNVSAPFHCALMKPAEEHMSVILNGFKFKNAKCPVVQNIDATETTDAETLRTKLIRQISGAVLWTQCTTRLRELGVTHIVELGPGQVLSGLIKKIDSTTFKSFNIHTIEDLKSLERQVKN